MDQLIEDRVTMALSLDNTTRAELWGRVVDVIENYTTDISKLRIGPDLDPAKVRADLVPLNFDRPMEPAKALEFTLDILMRHQTHVVHPRYFGLYDPAPSAMGVIAETLVAAFNPQLSVWIQSPGAVEIEQLLVRLFGEKFGYDKSKVDGTFTSGGAEANHTALLTALTHAFPNFVSKGLRALSSQPVLYVSSEGHHSVLKAAQSCGLGTEAVREIEIDRDLRMDVKVLSARIANDKAEGLQPFLIVGTAGTTNAGVVDPLGELGDIAAREALWFHVDSAWGGAVVLVSELRHLLSGIEHADSITFDPHKLLSVPRSAGLYLTRHPNILAKTFDVAAAYMPGMNSSEQVVDQFRHSLQWSRRFIGLKLFMTLAVAGWDGYAEVIRQQLSVGEYLRSELERSGWKVLNDSALGVLCFVDRTHDDGALSTYLEAIREDVVSSGEAWISITRLGKSTPALRACIVNYLTRPDDVSALVASLNKARDNHMLHGHRGMNTKE